MLPDVARRFFPHGTGKALAMDLAQAPSRRDKLLPATGYGRQISQEELEIRAPGPGMYPRASAGAI